MARHASVAAALLAACDPLATPGLVLDVGRACEDISLAVADPDVLPGAQIHQAAIARTGGDAGWYLATTDKLVLRRVPEDIPGIDLSTSGFADDFQLQRGPVEGQVWLSLDRGPSSRLWQIDEGSATITTGPPLSFPDSTPSWTRRVVFLGQSPYLVVVPRVSTVGRLPVHVAAITPSLATADHWELTAEVECPPFSELSCPLFWDDGRDVTLLDVAETGALAGAALLLAITSPVEAAPNPDMPPAFETHLLSVVLQLDPTAERPVLTRRDHVAWTTDGVVQPWPAQIAADSLGLYVLAGLIPGPDSSSANATMVDYLFRSELLGASSSDPGEVIALLPKEYGSHLLQLGSHVALGQKPGATWHVAPITGASIDEDNVGSLTIGERAELLRAGRGQAIVIDDAAASQRVQLACNSLAD